MKKKSIIALLLACSFAFGAAAFTGCNIVDDATKPEIPGNSAITPETPETPEGDKKDPVQNPDDTTGVDKNDPAQNPDDTTGDKDDENNTDDNTGDDNNDNKSDGDTSGGSGDDNDDKKPGGDDNNPVVSDKITYRYAGNECAAFEWEDTNPAGAKVEYKLSSASAYTRVDSQLIRASATEGTARVDVVGLKGGEKYDFKITTSAQTTLTATDFKVYSYDRSGYAHFGKSDGVGAYNNDGTPKSNARIIYLTEENKNNIDGNNTSIAQYLGSFKGNKNSTPIIIRVVGTVGSATWNSKKYAGYNKDKPLSAAKFVELTPGNGTLTLTSSSKKDYTQQELIDGGFNTLNLTPEAYNGATCAPIKGLNSKISCKSDSKLGYVYDSTWNDCTIENVKNVTIEGIGEDAEIFQWGFTFKNSSSVEVRNLHFDDYTEDGCSFEGSETGVTELSGFNSGNVWLHHNTFDEGMNYWDVCDEQDKGDGDGSTDFKGIKNITIAYNHYIKTHKTGLIGGDDKHATANVTFHHNYYEGCNQRMPLGRQANMHMYNNYYAASSLYSISLRAGAYAFIENCVFTEDASNHYPVELISGSYGKGAAKIINCDISEGKIQNSSGSDYLYVGTDRNATVTMTSQRFAKNFDTDSTLFYYKDGKSDVTQMLTAAETKTIVPKLAGVQKRNGDVTLGGGTTGGSTTGGNTGDTTGGNQGGTTGGETTQTKQITVASDFTNAQGKTSYTIPVSTEVSTYLSSAVIDVNNLEKIIGVNNKQLKLENATRVHLTASSTLPSGVKLVIALTSTDGINVTVDGTTTKFNVVDGKVTIDLLSGKSYTFGRVSGATTTISSFALVVPA